MYVIERSFQIGNKISCNMHFNCLIVMKGHLSKFSSVLCALKMMDDITFIFIFRIMNRWCLLMLFQNKQNIFRLKALSHSAIFLATCNAILLLGDVKLANTSFHHSLLIYFLHSKHLSQIYISQE